ncbi:MAG TPA: hypothetical protein VIH89_01915 [Candidatus Sulfotelmatobacter sp.]
MTGGCNSPVRSTPKMAIGGGDEGFTGKRGLARAKDIDAMSGRP